MSESFPQWEYSQHSLPRRHSFGVEQQGFGQGADGQVHEADAVVGFVVGTQLAAAEADDPAQALGIAPVAQGHGVAEGEGIGRDAVAQEHGAAVDVAEAGFVLAGPLVVEPDGAEIGAAVLLVKLVLLGRECRGEAVKKGIGPEKEILELAAGMIDGDEAPEAAVRREIQEELGYDIDKLEEIVTMWPSPGTSAESISVYYAEVSHQSGAGGGLAEENEKIEAVELSWDDLVAERLEDAKTLLAVQWARLRK
jgi:nudix-type nucleoside diphosphatase (YffH/AdpP family)